MQQPITMVCTRLADMTVMHPDQIECVCHKCGHIVGVYPTGQRSLERYPKMKIICSQCVQFDPDDKIVSAGTVKEIMQEVRDSKLVGHS